MYRGRHRRPGSLLAGEDFTVDDARRAIRDAQVRELDRQLLHGFVAILVMLIVIVAIAVIAGA